MSLLADTSSMLAGCLVASAYPGLGAPASAILAASAGGESGAGPLAGLGLDSSADYYWVITTPPASGNLVIYEDGSYSHTGAADGAWPWAASIYADGVLAYTLTITDAYGTTSSGTLSGNITLADAVPAGAITGATIAMTEPITIAEAKVAARLDADDTALDGLLAGLITAARQQAEQITGRLYAPVTVRHDLPGWPTTANVLPVPGPRAVAVSYWTGTEWATLAPGDFAFASQGYGTVVAPAVGTQWPALGAAALGPLVRIDITAGLEQPATAPEVVKLYIKAVVAFWVDNPTGAAGRGEPGDQLHRLLDRERIWA